MRLVVNRGNHLFKEKKVENCFDKKVLEIVKIDYIPRQKPHEFTLYYEKQLKDCMKNKIIINLLE